MTSLALTLASLALPVSLEERLDQFSELFRKWNRSINLSAARTEPELREHIVDSLHVVPHLRAAHASGHPATMSVLDVGAGGGLPAVIAALSLPDAHITALEPVRKKHAFLRAVVRELALPNLDPRAERLDEHAHRDYAAAMSRATFDLRDWLELGCARVRPGGIVLGFEAILRRDLPSDIERHPYALDDRSRAIVLLRRSP